MFRGTLFRGTLFRGTLFRGTLFRGALLHGAIPGRVNPRGEHFLAHCIILFHQDSGRTEPRCPPTISICRRLQRDKAGVCVKITHTLTNRYSQHIPVGNRTASSEKIIFPPSRKLRQYLPSESPPYRQRS
ncbi:MAG: hypothetical protein IJ493_00510 [Clostridia bacterium]|nr:hypothetical protein [Clostridia bacterium]